MPTYVYATCHCRIPKDGGAFLKEYELNVPMDKRDEQRCPFCATPLVRRIRFTGRVWAPTAGGTR